MFYMKTNEKYRSTDGPNVTQGQITRNLETEHLLECIAVLICSTDGQVGCVATGTFQSEQKSSLASKVLAGFMLSLE